MSDAARIPKLADDLELTSLEITPFEGFILSRIDGRMTLQDIADSTGASKTDVVALLERLGGAIEWVGERPRATARKSGPAPKRPVSQTTPSRGVVRTKPAPPGASRVLYDPAELEEDVDLDMERRREILDVFYRLEEMDHYQLLGVARSAEKREIRDAYFALSKRFHPDTLFGKRLGSYKMKMEGVFKRLTDAYDVLSRKKKRAKYDEYLEAHERLMGVERGLQEGAAAADDLEREVRATVEGAVVMPESEPEPSEPEPEPEPEPVTHSKPPTKAPPRLSATERRQRARALLEKRMGRTIPPAGKSSEPPPASKRPPSSKEDLLRGLATSLKQVARLTGGVERVERHLADAKTAEESGDLVGAVNAFRLALALDPERQDIAANMERLRRRLTTELADTYEKQALYEEEQENWEAAARSWAKVAEGRPGKAMAPRRAAEAILKADGDLRKAKELAQMAVDLQPNSVPNRLVLAQVFIAAGMSVSATKELDEAARLDPKDEMVKNLQRQLK